MKKKVLAIFSAVCMLAMSAMPAFAAESKVTSDVATQKAEAVIEQKSASDYANATKVETTGYAVSAVSETTATDAEKAVIAEVLNDVAKFAIAVGDDQLKAAATDENKKVVAEVLTVIEVDASAATKVDGKYVFTLAVDGVKAGDTVLVLHFVDGAWKKEACTVADGKITITADKCSPFSVTKVKIVAKQTSDSSSGSSSSSSSDSSAAATSTTPVSPKTGEAVPFVLFFAAAGVIGAIFCGKKFFA